MKIPEEKFSILLNELISTDKCILDRGINNTDILDYYTGTHHLLIEQRLAIVEARCLVQGVFIKKLLELLKESNAKSSN